MYKQVVKEQLRKIKVKSIDPMWKGVLAKIQTIKIRRKRVYTHEEKTVQIACEEIK